MPVYKKNSKWYGAVSYKSLDGKYKKAQTKYYPTKREAQEAEIVLRNKLKTTEKHSISFKDAYDEYRIEQKEKVKPQTLKKTDELFVYLEPLYKTKVEKLNAEQYKVFKEDLKKKEIGTTRKNRVHRLVCAICDYCERTYGISNPVPRKIGGFKETEIKKEMNFFTLDEFEKFISVEDDIVYKTLFSLLFYNGLRIGEATALTWEDYKDGKIRINKTLVTKIKGVDPFVSSPKTPSSNRTLPVNSKVKALLDELKAYYSKFPHFDEQWYVFGGFKPLSHTSIAERKNQNCIKAKVKKIRIHDFRHSCASYYIKHKNAPIILISKLLGHSKISITLDTYSHMYPNELDELMKD